MYLRTRRYVVQVSGGLEPFIEREIAELGGTELRRSVRAVEFTAGPAALYRVAYQSRFAGKLLAPIASFPARHPDELYKRAKAVAWEELMAPDATFAIFANVSDSRIHHSQFAALRLKDAIADRFRRDSGRRPSVDREAPQYGLSLHVRSDRATIALDIGGGALYRRGYRLRAGEAPMQEILAAGLVRFSGWDGARPLVDPMCGSGTLLAEAFMLAARIPAGYLRQHAAIERLPGFDAGLWAATRHAADAAITEVPDGLVSGSDRDGAAVRMALDNLARLPGGERVRVEQRDVARAAGVRRGVLVVNPPYGLRIGRDAALDATYAELGRLIAERCPGSTAVVYSADTALLSALRVPVAERRSLTNGGLKGTAVKLLVPA
ncbi:MAG TPA: THUMP domain-containing protein [Polyangiaceae bacterium]|nr:THUMP domain-containing protein [Polyangiaceae bacterium]